MYFFVLTGKSVPMDIGFTKPYQREIQNEVTYRFSKNTIKTKKEHIHEFNLF